ncbi:MAG: sulfurtransferase [Bryobacterales bacterium]|nr:sulfurtransferase [Bryobacterales bacterium]
MTGKTHSAGFLALVESAKTRIRRVDVAGYVELAGNGTEVVLVDVREESEWTAGHAQGAIHLSKGLIERDIEHLFPDKDTTLVLYCGGGYRSALAADNLQTMGYRAAISLDGGWRAWNEAGLPVEIP